MENISKIVLTQKGKKVGYVLDVAVNFDDMQKQGYFVVDEETESEFLLRCEDITSQSSDFLLIEDVSVLEFATERKSVFGKEILDDNCLSYGFVQGLSFKKRKCEKLITEKCEILTKYVKKVGDDFVLVNFKRKKMKSTQSFPRTDLEVKVKVQSVEPPIVPERILLSPSSYLGKISNEDIMGYNNEKIVRKGEIITKVTVEKAKIHNKLNQLFFAIKR